MIKTNQTSKIQERKFSLKQVLTIVAIITLLTAGISCVVFYTPSPSQIIYPEDLPSPCSYVIKTNGTHYWATRYDGKQLWTGTNASMVINNALSALTSGRTYQEKVALNGNFTISNAIKVPAYTFLDLTNARIYLNSSSNCNIFENTNSGVLENDRTIFGGFLDGNKAGQTSGNGIRFFGERIRIQGVTIRNCRDYAITLPGVGGLYSRRVWILDNSLINNEKGAVDAFQLGTAWVIGNNCFEQGVSDCTDFQFDFDGGFEVWFRDNYVLGGVSSGVRFRSITESVVAGNRIKGFNRHGLILGDCSDTRVIGNIFIEIARSGTNLYDGIYIWGASNNNHILYNDFKSAGALRYAINEAGGDNNQIAYNRIQVGTIKTVGANSTVGFNLGYTTENSGNTTVANNEWVLHGLATTPKTVLVTTQTATYGGVPVVVGWIGQNATHFQVSAYWTNSTAITADAINISWYAEV